MDNRFNITKTPPSTFDHPSRFSRRGFIRMPFSLMKFLLYAITFLSSILVMLLLGVFPRISAKSGCTVYAFDKGLFSVENTCPYRSA